MSLELFSLEGKVSLVTGASKGIGKAISMGMARAGADLVLVSRQIQPRDQIVVEIEDLGRNVITMPTDVTIVDEVKSMVSRSIEVFGRIDILVNSAGVVVKKEAMDITADEWDKVLDTNLKGYFLCAQAVSREMVKTGRGSIINIASIRSKVTMPALAAYSASKGAVTMLTKTLALELASHNIRVNEIGPGYINTPMTEYLKNRKDEYKLTISRIPMRRWGEPEELVGAAIFLASEASNYMTGQTIFIDGGWLCW